MAINQGSILDHLDKPAIRPDDAVYQSLTATSDGKVEVTVNGVGVTDYVYGKGVIECAGHATNYLALKNGLKSGQSVVIKNTGSVTLKVENESSKILALIPAGINMKLEWSWVSTTSGGWYLGMSPNRVNTISVSNSAAAVTKTLVANESGSIVFIAVESDTGSRGIDIVMPTPVAGLNYTFVLTDAGNGTNDVAFKTATDAVDFKGAANSVKTGVEGGVIAHSTITLDLSDLGTQTDADGTSFKVITDGSHWYIIGGVVFGGEDAIGTGFELTTTTDVDD